MIRGTLERASMRRGRNSLLGVLLAMSLTSPIIAVRAGLRVSMGSHVVALSNMMNCGQLGPANVSAWSLAWHDPRMNTGVTISVFSRMH